MENPYTIQSCSILLWMVACINHIKGINQDRPHWLMHCNYNFIQIRKHHEMGDWRIQNQERKKMKVLGIEDFRQGQASSSRCNKGTFGDNDEDSHCDDNQRSGQQKYHAFQFLIFHLIFSSCFSCRSLHLHLHLFF